MYDPFKHARAITNLQMLQTMEAVFNNILSTSFYPGAPAKRTAPETKTVARLPSRPGKVVGKSRQRAKTIHKSGIPATLRAKPTKRGRASFTKGIHICEFGQRSFKLYIPAIARIADTRLPLLVMLHGCKQTPEDFARGTGMNALAEEFGFLVLYPAQEAKSQIYRCWNWYKPDDQVRGSGEPALLASMVSQIITKYRVDPGKVYVAGLSAGASAALIIADAYPDIFAAVGTHSGLPVGAAHNGLTAVIAMKFGAPGLQHSDPMPTIDFHGSSDKVVNPRNGRFIISRALDPYSDLGKTVKSGQKTDGRKYVRTSYRLGTGRSFIEHWVIEGADHAWSGGNAANSYTDPAGPDASREMVQFFLRHRTTAKRRSRRPPGF
ncbi:extracellular catalytic domain type 1 short-chain-length polyhydroxyalkanoate depolymerase [Thalassospira mesophila]|uniref:PHB depolymerase esterase n=1 Tax=Thalassospira mesophila TaxID=1293891 RepID=A0A1Y2KVB3_9PROT|nr:PHB depolymerase family esterase [Thalassospira mesophila]OSQ35735.1 PHB depolymerase esterase [Thalassospira mesophila]